MKPFNPLHHKLPELQKSEEVTDAVAKHTRLTGEKVPNTPDAKLAVYMDRLENIFLNKDEATRKRNIEMLRENIYDVYIIKHDDVPESYFELQKRVARERGQTVEEIDEATKEQMIQVVIEDQKASLDAWIDYLSSNDAMYPTWFKYFVFRNIVKLSQFDKELGKFKERTSSTTAPFPDIYREALAQVADLYKTAARDKALFNDPDFQNFLSKKFPTQYADKIQQTLEHSQEEREQIKGEWMKYEQGDEDGAKKLYASLQNKGTGWCTAGSSTAEAQIESGDFYVFYTYDKQGSPTQPRLAIRMDGTDAIGEVRGILPHQEVEPLLQDTLDEKLATFGNEAEQYKKKSSDMKRLTAIEKAAEEKKNLAIDDLRFLYEIDTTIEGFGYEKDPRIQELRQKRNRQGDFAVIFCKGDISRVAETIDDINQDSLVFSGDLRIDKNFSLDDLKKLDQIMFYGKVTILGDSIPGEVGFYLAKQQDKKHIAFLFKALDRFIGLSQETMKLLLEEYGMDEAITENLLSFDSLNQKFADEIFENFKKEDKAKEIILNGLASFRGLNEKTLKKLAEDVDEHNFILEKISSFEGLSESSIVILDISDIFLAKNLSHFRNLSHEIASRLFKEGFDGEVARNQSSFILLDSFQIAIDLLNDLDYEVIEENKEFFKNVDKRKIQEYLFEKDQEKTVLYNLPFFDNIDHQQFAERWLVEDDIEEFVNVFKEGNFCGLNFTIAEELIEKGYGEEVVDTLGSFSDLDNSVLVQLLIESGYEAKVESCLSLFKNLNQRIAEWVLSRESGEELIIKHISSFSNLNQEFANKLIDRKIGFIIAENMQHFSGINKKALAELLLADGQGWAVSDNLSSFGELDEETISKVQNN